MLLDQTEYEACLRRTTKGPFRNQDCLSLSSIAAKRHHEYGIKRKDLTGVNLQFQMLNSLMGHIDFQTDMVAGSGLGFWDPRVHSQGYTFSNRRNTNTQILLIA